MKLAASWLCVAALSLVGCADVETNGGGQGEGILPAKSSVVEPTGQMQLELGEEPGFKQRLRSGPADFVCEGCVIDTYAVVDNSMFNEVSVVSDGGMQLCRLYLSDGEVVIDECGINKP